MTVWRFLLLLFVLLVSLPQQPEAQLLAVDPQTCLECHSDSIDLAAYAASVHGGNSCTSCHRDLVDFKAHTENGLQPARVHCAPCHKQIAAQHASSIHNQQGISCVGCHSAIHRQQVWRGNKKTVVHACLRCHANNGYRQSVHGQSLLAGNDDAPACHDCHKLHTIQPLVAVHPGQSRALHSDACIPCHEDAGLIDRNSLPGAVVSSFIRSYHGKSYRLGFPESAAGCADCHRAHLVLPQENPASSLHQNNLVGTCGACHAAASPLFIQYYPHADHHDRQGYPLLYWSYIGMTVLLICCFALLCLHSLCWMFRSFVESRQGFAGQRLAAGYGGADAKIQYRRFGKQHIVLHLLVIISFFGLILTGLPLKFSDQEWAQIAMTFLGGVRLTGVLHRFCALLAFGCFGATLVMMMLSLFSRRHFAGSWRRRLFGPDSLLPNGRDLDDLRNMVRWFFARGPKPTFERWTYWEKLDFFAVLSATLVIGGSGLVLWFPEFFGRFLPGWMFNVVTIIHSDIALLGASVLLLGHFFNTSFRPEKFPLDFVIFNGQVAEEDLIAERGDQWQRNRQAGVSEQLMVEKPSSLGYDFFLRGVGYIAIFAGLVLVLLMILGFIVG